MQGKVVITGADRGLGYALCERFLHGGWQVFAGQYMPEWKQLAQLGERYPSLLCCLPLDVGDERSIAAFARALAERTEAIDMLVSNAGVPSRGDTSSLDVGEEDLLRVYRVNAVAAPMLTQALLPLLERGAGKRLCYVSSEAGSVSMNTRDTMYGYCMSKSALNMAVRMMFCEMYPQGYTFRLYHPGWMRSYMGGVKNTVGELEPEESAVVAYRQFITDRPYEARLLVTDERDREIPY